LVEAPTQLLNPFVGTGELESAAMHLNVAAKRDKTLIAIRVFISFFRLESPGRTIALSNWRCREAKIAKRYPGIDALGGL